MKKRLGITDQEVATTLAALLEYPVLPITGELVTNACEIKARYAVSYWDAAIIAAARALGSKIIYSEDLNSGQDYGGVVVINPFVKS